MILLAAMGHSGGSLLMSMGGAVQRHYLLADNEAGEAGEAARFKWSTVCLADVLSRIGN